MLPSIRISKYLSFVLCIYYGIFAALCSLSILHIPLQSWLKLFSILTLGTLMFHVIVIKLKGMRLISLSFFFVVLSYAFHFGQVLLVGLVPEYDFQAFNMVFRVDQEYLKLASTFSLLVIDLVVAGLILTDSFQVKHLQSSRNLNSTEVSKSIGWVLVVTMFPIQVYLDFLRASLSLQFGYLATYNTGLPGIVGDLGFLSFTGWALLILGYSERKKTSLLLFAFVTSYLFLTMISGHRGHQLTVILFLFVLISRSIVEISWRTVFLIALAGFLLVSIINAAFYFRHHDEKTVSQFLALLFQQIQVNPIGELIAEMGGTIITPTLVIQQIPSYRGYGYGSTYFLSFVSILPDVGDIFSDINLSASFAKNIVGSALGGSYIGELYYNFSFFGIPFGLLVGLFVGTVSRKVESLIISGDFLSVGYYASLSMYILWWPRDSFQSILRPWVWGAIVVFGLRLIMQVNKRNTEMDVSS